VVFPNNLSRMEVTYFDLSINSSNFTVFWSLYIKVVMQLLLNYLI